jgi:hypothetical protein
LFRVDPNIGWRKAKRSPLSHLNQSISRKRIWEQMFGKAALLSLSCPCDEDHSSCWTLVCGKPEPDRFRHKTDIRSRLCHVSRQCWILPWRHKPWNYVIVSTATVNPQTTIFFQDWAGLFGVTMSVLSRTDALLDRMREMSAADISVLEAAATGPSGAGLTTMLGSPNDILWTDMERAGWMTSLIKELPANGLQLQLKVFRLEEAGQAPVRDLLERLRPKMPPVDGQTVLQRLAPQLDAISNEMTPRLINTVREAGGNGSHIVIGLSHVIARIVRRTFRPEDQKNVLQDIVKQAEKFLAEMSL